MKFLVRNITLFDGQTVTLNVPNQDIKLLHNNSIQHFLYEFLFESKKPEYYEWRPYHKYRVEMFDY